MAARDIMPWNGPNGQYPRIQHFRINASEGFFDGEPVAVNADGELTESATEPVPADLLGIALGGPGAARNPATGNAWATGDLAPVCVFDSNHYFITSNFTAAGSAFDDTAPAVANLGDQASLALISGSWGIDAGPSTNDATCRIIDILNARKESIQVTGETLSTGDLYYVVFVVVAHQNTPDSAEAAAPAA
jgi:hypothetical protein